MELFSLNVFSGHLNTENFGECGLQFVIHGQSTVLVMPVVIHGLQVEWLTNRSTVWFKT